MHRLRHRLDQALRLHFGQRSERSRPRRARAWRATSRCASPTTARWSGAAAPGSGSRGWWSATASWCRIFDFGNNTTTYMFLTPQNGSTTRLRFGITTMCIGLGMGGTVIWENLQGGAA